MMPDKLPLRLTRFDASMGRLDAVLSYVEQKAQGMAPEALLRAQTALEELFTNCVVHGSQGPNAGSTAARGAENCIWLGVQRQGAYLHLQLEDPFAAFDPFVRVSEESTFGYLPVEDRPVGGLGVLMVARLADAVFYTRTPDRNCVSLRFAPRK